MDQYVDSLGPLKFEALDYFNIKDIGIVAIISIESIPKDRELLVGDCIYVDEELYMCNGIQMFGSQGHAERKKTLAILLKEIEFI